MAEDKKTTLEDSILGSAQEVDTNVAPPAERSFEGTGITQEQFDKELELQKKYGDSDTRAFLEGTASGLTFGVSDQILKKIVGEEALRERRQRNREAALTGEILGAVAPALTTGGTSLLARGATKAGAAVTTVSKAGLLTEKAIAKAIQQTGKKKLARSILEKSVSKGAGSAVEGAFYGVGELVKEDALGTAEFNAQNLASFAGTGALLGGAAGGILGTAEALIPVVKNNKVTDFVRKKVDTNVDTNQAAAELSGLTPSKLTKVKRQQGYVYDNLTDYYKNSLKLNVKDDIQTIYKKNLSTMEKLGEDISKTLNTIDNIADDSVRTSRDSLARKMQKQLDELAEDFRGVKSVSAKQKLARVEKEIAEWDDWLNQTKTISGKELNSIKQKYQKLAKYDRDPLKASLDEKINRKLAAATREEVLDLADRVSSIDQDLGAQLRKQNLDYSTGATIAESLEKKVDKDAQRKFLQFRDMLLGNIFLGADAAGLGAVAVAGKKFAESDLRRKLQILSSIENANRKVESKIGSSIKNFFTKARRISSPTSTKILLNTSFDPEGKSKKSNSRAEGFKRIRQEIVDLNASPDKLIERLSKNSLRLTKAAPETAAALEQSIARAVTFLSSKLPGPKLQQGTVQMLMKRKDYKPSSLELAKFERYVEGVEQPLTLLDDLESGRISREKVEAVREVYPDLYMRIQSQAMEFIAEKADDIGYEKRLQLGILLGIPADTSLVPQNMINLQKTFLEQPVRGEQQPAETGAVSTTQGGLQQIDFASETMTDAQRVATRK